MSGRKVTIRVSKAFTNHLVGWLKRDSRGRVLTTLSQSEAGWFDFPYESTAVESTYREAIHKADPEELKTLSFTIK